MCKSILSEKQINGLRELAGQVCELSLQESNLKNRQLWVTHNSLKKVKPPVYVRLNCWHEVIPESAYLFPNGIFRDIEHKFRTAIYNHNLGFDDVVDSFVTVPAFFDVERSCLWGVKAERSHSGVAGGAWSYSPPLVEYDDIEKLVKPVYKVDLQKTDELRQNVNKVIGDIIPVIIDYSGPLGISASLAQHAADLRGLQQLMLDVMENPDWVHRLMSFLTEGHLEYMEEMEKQSKVFPNHMRWPFYSEPLRSDFDPACVRIKDCWGYGESQEFDLFSPAMFDEFLLPYQLKIFERTGLNGFGCCENLTHKYPLLEKIPGLRRVSISPWTDYRTAIEWSAGRYVMYWRYPPQEFTFNFSEEKIRQTVRRNLEIAADTPVEIILQDVETLNGEPWKVEKWVKIVMEEAERHS